MRPSGCVTALRAAALALGIVVAWMISTVALAQDVELTTEVLEEQIWELRLQASYAEALEIARELVVVRKGDPDAAPFEIADAERLVETLEHIVVLPVEAKRELALADSLTEVDEPLRAEGRYAEAAAAMERQLEIRRRLLGNTHPDVAESLNNLAMNLLSQGDHAGAEPLHREALAMRRSLLGDEHPDVAQSLNNLGILLMARGDYVGAEPLHREALATWRELLGDEDPDVALSLGNLASVLWAQGDYAGAEPLLREALAMKRKLLGDEHPGVALGISNLASVLMAQGDYAGAEPLLREALAMRRRLHGDEHQSVAEGLNNLAGLLVAQGDYAGAEPLFRKALAMWRKLLGNEHPHVAQSLNNLAYLLYAQGDHAGAEPLFREALAMRRKLLGSEHPDVAQSLNNLASLLNARGDYAGAEPLFREALTIWRKLLGNEHPTVATSLSNLAVLLENRGDYAGAEPLYRESLAMRRKVLGDEHPDVALALRNLACLLYADGDYAGAEPLYRDALAMRRKLLGDEHPDVAASLVDLADLLTARGDDAGAEPLLAEAARVHDSARLRAGAGLKRTTFQASPYPRLAVARLALGRREEAWPAAEKAQARSLADLLMAAEERELTWAEAAREDSLKKVLGELERELAAYREAARRDTTAEAVGRVEETRDELLAAEAEWSAFQQEIALTHPLTEGQAFPLERVQSVLSEQTAIIGWLDIEIRRYEYESWCYLIRRTGPVTWARASSSAGEDGSRSPFERARSLRNRLSSAGSWDVSDTRDSQASWGERIRPVLGALSGADQLVVVPSGAMVGVPVEALVDDEGMFTGEKYAVSYVPSATLHTWLVEQRGGEVGGRVLLVGDPPFNPSHLAAMEPAEEILVDSAEPMPGPADLRSAVAGNDEALRSLPRLSGTRDEVAGVAGLSERSSLLLGPDATERELVRLAESGELREFGTIHLATHALIDDERPERSALVLSQVGLPDPLEAAMAGARVYDGLVTAEEILREWDLRAELVTLSACETGLGKKVVGEGYIGFAHAFLQAGAGSLLVSLWAAEDKATSLLMRRFYENWLGEYGDERAGRVGEPMTKANALQEAKHWLRDYTDEYGGHPFEHPYFWSAFILIGDRS